MQVIHRPLCRPIILRFEASRSVEASSEVFVSSGVSPYPLKFGALLGYYEGVLLAQALVGAQLGGKRFFEAETHWGTTPILVPELYWCATPLTLVPASPASSCIQEPRI